MDWIKRNLLFVIGAGLALGLLIFAGYYNYAGWHEKNVEGDTLTAKYEDLKRLNNQNPHPGFGKVDNIKLAREQQQEIRALIHVATNYFRAPPPLPAPVGGVTNITSSQFTAALRETLNQLTRAAGAASVQLPPDYKFSFTQQLRLLTFAEGSLLPLAEQLGEVKVLSEILIRAKVNTLDAIQRERVSPDDLAGPQTDYHTLVTQTNELARLTPYQVTFRSFSHEIAQVLAAIANSPYGFIVQAINVEPAVVSQPGLAGYAPGMTPADGSVWPTDRRADYAASYALNSGVAVALPGAPGGTRPAVGPQTVLNEKQLRVTLQVQVVKLLAKNEKG